MENDAVTGGLGEVLVAFPGMAKLLSDTHNKAIEVAAKQCDTWADTMRGRSPDSCVAAEQLGKLIRELKTNPLDA